MGRKACSKSFNRGENGRESCPPEIRVDILVIGSEGYISRGAVRLSVAALVVNVEFRENSPAAVQIFGSPLSFQQSVGARLNS